MRSDLMAAEQPFRQRRPPLSHVAKRNRRNATKCDRIFRRVARTGAYRSVCYVSLCWISRTRVRTCYVVSRRRGTAFELWQEVDRRRQEHEWTFDQLAEHAGVARQTIDRLRFTDKPAARTVHGLADALGMDRAEARRLAAGQTGTTVSATLERLRQTLDESTDLAPEHRQLLILAINAIAEANAGRRPE